MAKSNPQAHRGNFRAFKNTSKEIGDDRPLFQGKLTLPNSKDERSFALWPYASGKDGATILSGRAGASANSQIAAYTQPSKEQVERMAVELPSRNGAEPFRLEPDAVVLFTNKTKQEANPDRPDYYGFYNPGDGTTQRLAVWSQLDRYGSPMLSGSLQTYEPALDKQQDDAGPPPEAAKRELEHTR